MTEKHEPDSLTVHQMGRLVFPTAAGDETQEWFPVGRRVYADWDKNGPMGFCFRDLATGEVVAEGMSDEISRTIVEVVVGDTIRKYPGRTTYFRDEEPVAQFISVNAGGLIAFGREVIKDREKMIS